jgi:hypothetical protein
VAAVSLKTLQKLIVVSSLVWALLPTWGGLLFASSWVVLAVATVSRVRAARAIIDAHRDDLAKGLSEDALAWVRRVPFVYVWRDAAKEWGTTWRMTGILTIFLMPWFAIRALVFHERWELALLAPLLVLLVVGVRVALRLEVQELVKEARWQAFAAHHEDASRYLMLRSTLGKWPPVPSPDGIPGTPAPPNFSPPVRPPPAPMLSPPKTVRPPGDDEPKGDKPS